MATKKTEEEFPLPQELREQLLHHMLVEMNKALAGRADPEDIADQISASIAPDLTNDDTLSFSWRVKNGSTVTIRVYQWLIDVMDFVAARYAVSRNKLITDQLYRHGLPDWLELIRTNDEGLEGSLWYTHKMLDLLAKRSEHDRRGERSIGPIMEEIRSRIATMDWAGASRLLHDVVETADRVSERHWRRRMIEQITGDGKRLRMIMTTLGDHSVDGIREVAATIEAWGREA